MNNLKDLLIKKKGLLGQIFSARVIHSVRSLDRSGLVRREQRSCIRVQEEKPRSELAVKSGLAKPSHLYFVVYVDYAITTLNALSQESKQSYYETLFRKMYWEKNEANKKD